LPVAEFDHLEGGLLEWRVASLDLEQLEQLIGYGRNTGPKFSKY
jgi:hypothetical protein